ncbi:MAG: hypothetical protein KGL39_08930 [Patescibacteria group bacterium]|nr:hypothetical protein [Patescibacteria group bacterium]
MATTILGPEWAVQASNAVFDTSARLAARKGWLNQTTTPITGTPSISQLHELVKLDGTTQIIGAANNKLYLGVSSPSDITGTATVTANNWQFVNFNGKCYGFQQGMAPIVYDGSTAFANLAATDAGTIPQGNCALVHSGRIWAAGSDKQTIQYSALLDATKWATASGAGSIDMTSVWPGDMDVIQAMAFYNGRMIVFGKNRIVIFADSTGSPLGINPNNLYVVDTVIGVGCIARDSVQQIEGGDILFLSSSGLESLQRVVIEKSNPLNNLSRNVRDYLALNLVGADLTQIRSVYSPENAFYLLSIPTSGLVLCFSTIVRMEDGSLRVTEWDSFVPSAMFRSLDTNIYASLGATTGGQIGVYSGYQDNNNSYTFQYSSGWMNAGEDIAQYFKILKSIAALLYISAAANVTLTWAFDFVPPVYSQGIVLTSPGASQWGIMQYGIDDWSGGLALQDLIVSTSGYGQYIQIGLQATINGADVALQQFNLYTKIGRMAR